MKQVLLEQPGRFALQESAPPAPRAGEALVRVRRVGVCGTDLHAFEGRQPYFTYPRILGHELAAEIVDVPENGSGLRAGDRCAVEPYLSCGSTALPSTTLRDPEPFDLAQGPEELEGRSRGVTALSLPKGGECRACLKGKPNCCERLRVLGVHTDGGMRERLAVPLERLHKSERLDFDQLVLVEPLSIGAHAVARSGLTKGEEVLVVGAGPIGLAVVQFALVAGGRVRVLEVNPIRRAFAERFGVEVLAAADPSADGQADVVFDATGNAAAMAESFARVSPGGRLVFVGLVQGAVALDDPLFHGREITLLATRNSANEFPRIIRLIEDGRIDTALWITHRMGLAEVPARFPGLTQERNFLKAVIEVG